MPPILLAGAAPSANNRIAGLRIIDHRTPRLDHTGNRLDQVSYLNLHNKYNTIGLAGPACIDYANPLPWHLPANKPF